jgi:hypothetical protein
VGGTIYAATPPFSHFILRSSHTYRRTTLITAWSLKGVVKHSDSVQSTRLAVAIADPTWNGRSPNTNTFTVCGEPVHARIVPLELSEPTTIICA